MANLSVRTTDPHILTRARKVHSVARLDGAHLHGVRPRHLHGKRTKIRSRTGVSLTTSSAAQRRRIRTESLRGQHLCLCWVGFLRQLELQMKSRARLLAYRPRSYCMASRLDSSMLQSSSTSEQAEVASWKIMIAAHRIPGTQIICRCVSRGRAARSSPKRRFGRRIRIVVAHIGSRSRSTAQRLQIWRAQHLRT